MNWRLIIWTTRVWDYWSLLFRCISFNVLFSFWFFLFRFFFLGWCRWLSPRTSGRWVPLIRVVWASMRLMLELLRGHGLHTNRRIIRWAILWLRKCWVVQCTLGLLLRNSNRLAYRSSRLINCWSYWGHHAIRFWRDSWWLSLWRPRPHAHWWCPAAESWWISCWVWIVYFSITLTKSWTIIATTAASRLASSSVSSISNSAARVLVRRATTAWPKTSTLKGSSWVCYTSLVSCRSSSRIEFFTVFISFSSFLMKTLLTAKQITDQVHFLSNWVSTFYIVFHIVEVAKTWNLKLIPF